MSIDDLKTAIAGMLDAHPCIIPSDAGHCTHAGRYTVSNGANVGWRSNLKTQQNLYVELHRVRLTVVADISHEVHLATARTGDEPNADLFHSKAFSRADDVVAFKITDIWQAVRVFAEVAGLAA